MGYYHTAQICLNGHMINDSSDSNPQNNQDYCDKCGEKTITKCPNCNALIRGDYEVPGVCAIGFATAVPSYCYHCGKPFPWTELSLKSAKELLELEGSLSEEDLKYFDKNMNSLICDTPNTKVVATKLKLFLTKASAAVGSTLKDIIVEIGSETAKKIILNE